MYESFGASDPGCVRSNNEDYYLIAQDLGLYIVADGMGGAQAGEHASKIASEAVAGYLWNSQRLDGNSLLRAFEEANERVMEAAEKDERLEGMGTTLVAALENEASLLLASVGDSRAYLLQDGIFRAITDDQTWVNEVGRRLGIDETSLKTHPMRHVLTMAVGVSTPLRILSYTITPKPGATVLLCSDGLHSVVNEEEIASCLLKGRNLPESAHYLIEAARRAGGPDNITVLLLRAM